MNKPTLSSSSRIVLLVFGILLFGSVFFFRQRMLFVDPCFITFNILNEHSLIIQEHRFGAFITQIVPLIGAWFHLPLSIVLLAYSASFYIFFLTVVLILIFRWRQCGLALLMAFYFTLMVSDVYFWPNNEVHQGIAWMFLFFGYILHQSKSRSDWWFHLIALVIAFLAIFSHHLVFIPFSFLWIYFLLERNKINLSPLLLKVYTLGIITLFFIKFVLGINGWYDGEKLRGVTGLTWQKIANVFSGGHADSMYNLFISNYWVVIFILLTGIFYQVRNKKYNQFLLTITFALGYFILVCITFPDAFGKELLFYMESQWMAFAIIAATPFVVNFLPQLKEKLIIGFLLLIFGIRFFYIGQSAVFFDNRFHVLEQTVTQIKNKGLSKVIISKDHVTDSLFLMDWGLPVESLTLSVMVKHNPPVTFKVMQVEDIKPVSKDTFLSSFIKMGYQDMNRYYYPFDTVASYKVMTYHELFKK